MKGWDIFIHSAKLVLNNLGNAFRVSIVLYAIIALIQIFLFLQYPNTAMFDPMNPAAMDAGGLAVIFLLSLVTVVLSLWIAVAWHRYALLGELPDGYMPSFHGGRILGYLGRSILIGIMVMLIVFAVVLPFALIGVALGEAAAGVLGAIGGLIAVFVAIVAFYRLAPILPAGAVGESLSLRQAWDGMKGTSGTVLLLALISFLAAVIIQLPGLAFGGDVTVLGLIYTIVTQWFVTMIGASVLTTLYGHFIEGRPIA